MQTLCDSADVFIENYRPGALDKLGLSYKELSERNPKLVYCSISAYGHTGPDSHRAGFGLIAEAKSGIMQMVGVPGEAPPLLRVSLGDMYTGIHAVAAINAALLGRVSSDKSQHIDMALYDTHGVHARVRGAVLYPIGRQSAAAADRSRHAHLNFVWGVPGQGR